MAASVVLRKSVCIALLIAALNGLDVMGADIGNAYLTAPPQKKYGLSLGSNGAPMPANEQSLCEPCMDSSRPAPLIGITWPHTYERNSNFTLALLILTFGSDSADDPMAKNITNISWFTLTTFLPSRSNRTFFSTTSITIFISNQNQLVRQTFILARSQARLPCPMVSPHGATADDWQRPAKRPDR